MACPRPSSGRPRVSLPFTVLLTAVVLMLAHHACADDIYVSTTTGNDTNNGTTPLHAVATIQAAILLAQPFDTVQILPGLYTGPGNTNVVTFGLPITVTSMQQDASTTVIACGNTIGVSAFRFIFSETSDTVLQFVTMMNCTSIDGGAVVIDNASPTITNNVFAMNTAVVGGGAVSATGSGTLILDGNTFIGNQAASMGGAVASLIKDVHIVNNVFQFNFATVGGAIYLASTSSGIVKNNQLAGNGATNGGGIMMNAVRDVQVDSNSLVSHGALFGTIFLEGCSSISFSNLHFSDNTAGQVYGIRILYSEDITISDCEFENNVIQGNFGALTTEGSYNVLVQRSTFRNNNDPNGFQTAHWCRRSVNLRYEDCLWENQHAIQSTIVMVDPGCYGLVFDRCTFRNCTSQTEGNSWYFYDSDTTFNNCLFEKTVGGRGAAMQVFKGSNVTLFKTTFEDNYSTAGSAIFVDFIGGADGDAMIAMDQCTFTGNEAAIGGAIYLDAAVGYIDGIEGNTFRNNRADVGAAMYTDGTTVVDKEHERRIGKYKCGDCRGNEAEVYGDDFASNPTAVRIIDSPDEFNNLQSFESSAEAIDAYGNRVRGLKFAIKPVIAGSGAKAGLVDANTVTTDDSGIAKFGFSIVSDFSQKVELNYVEQSLNIESASVDIQAQDGCLDGEVIVDFPPNTNAFPVCVEADTQQPDTTVKVFWIITGILMGALMLLCIVLSVYITCFDVRVLAGSNGEDYRPFIYDLSVGWCMFIGIFAGCTACIIQIPDPTDSLCTALPWMWCLCAVLISTPLVTSIVYLAASSSKANGRVPTWVTLTATGVMLALNAVVLIVWTVIDPLELGYAQDEADLTKQCEGDHTMVFVGVLIGLNAIGLSIALILTFGGEFGKFRSARWASHVQNLGLAVTHITFVATATIILLFLKYDDYSARYIIQACGFLLCAYVLVLLLFILPMYMMFSGEFDATTFTAGSTYSGTESGTVETGSDSSQSHETKQTARREMVSRKTMRAMALSNDGGEGPESYSSSDSDTSA
eukprot:TRINITY_DN1875_c1_g1_i1.p1 TRINITY_DN1875_c1_g1~~TRINITY_DN1875_c1_g1_i1.p1  ORF type:complete len:1033 (-),score=235.46 TRINITY_DN1875_c1_g1_i1:61-3159(-)